MKLVPFNRLVRWFHCFSITLQLLLSFYQLTELCSFASAVLLLTDIYRIELTGRAVSTYFRLQSCLLYLKPSLEWLEKVNPSHASRCCGY